TPSPHCTLSLHDALPISITFSCANFAGIPKISSLPQFTLAPWKDHISYGLALASAREASNSCRSEMTWSSLRSERETFLYAVERSEEHTSELQSHLNLVC